MPTATRRATSRWRTPLLIVHVTAAVSLVGTTLGLIALGVAGLRGADPRTVYPAASLLESWLGAPLAVLTLTTGILQAATGYWGLLRYWWTAIKLATTTIMTALVLFLVVPALAATAHTATQGHGVPHAQRLRTTVIPTAACALLIANTTLGLTKPRRRLRRPGRGATTTPTPTAARQTGR